MLHYAAECHREGVVLWELLTADIQCIESIRAIGTMLQQVLLRFRLFLHGLVLPEAVASTFYTCRLNSEYQVIVILAVEERHESLFACEALIDEQVLLIVTHRIAEIHIVHLPPVAFKLRMLLRAI